MQKLQTNLNNSQIISNCLTQIKSKLIQKQYHNTTEPLGVEDFQRVIQLRKGFRELAEGLEINCRLVELKKDQIQKNKVFLEGLQYYKATLNTKIKDCHIVIEDLSDYMQPNEINWEEPFQNIEERLDSHLKTIRNKQQQLENKIKMKQTLEKEIKVKQQLYNNQIPIHAQKIYQQVEQTCKIIGNVKPISLQHIKCLKISKIFDMLSPIQYLHHIQLIYVQNQSLQIIIHHINQHQLYQLANSNKINLVSYSIRIIICYLNDISKLVIGVDRSSDFTTEEVLHRLIANQPIQSVFSSPKNQAERNINNKFCFLEWVENMLSYGVINGIGFIEIIRERLFCIKLNKYLFEHMHKLTYFQPLIKEGEGTLNIKKVNLTNITKINFQQYLNYVHIPNWVDKTILHHQLLVQQLKRQSLDYQLHNPIDKSSLMKFLNHYSIEQKIQPNLNQYYRVTIHIHNQTFNAIFIIPLSYPRMLSKVKIIQHRKKHQQKNNPFFDSLENLGKFTQQNQTTYQLIYIQKEVNQQIKGFLKKIQDLPFYLLLQINRLICLLSFFYSKDSEKDDISSKYQLI